MLYGIIREMVSNITSRSWYGQIILPSVNFRDHAPGAKQDLEKEDGDKTEKSTVRKIKVKAKAVKVEKAKAS
ncbi:MAG: hypothetical protein V4632_17285 [Pseudomonadota bacterium]